MHAQIVLFDGFDPLDVVAPLDVLWAAGMLSDGGCTVELVSAGGAREVVAGSAGVALRSTGPLDPERPGAMVVPGASGRIGADDDVAPDTVAGRLAATLDSDLPGLLGRALAAPDVLVATVCGGSLVLAMAGLIEHRHAVTHHLGMDLLDATGTVAVPARVVDDGDLVSAGGVTSGLDLALYLVERLCGPQLAIAVEQLFAYERRGTVWQARGLRPVNR
jgi:transcriptional regulator GlxA family with amidase domain